MASTPTGYHIHLNQLNIMSYIQIPSICIKRVWHKFDKNYIEGVFCELFGPDATGESCVERVDLIPKKDRRTDEPFWVVFVHFSPDVFSSDYLLDFANRIANDEEVMIQYNPPWFWKVSKNSGSRKDHARTGPRIMSSRDEKEFLAKQKEILAEQAGIRGDDISKIPPPCPLERTSIGEDSTVDFISEELKRAEDVLKTPPSPLEWGADADEHTSR